MESESKPADENQAAESGNKNGGENVESGDSGDNSPVVDRAVAAIESSAAEKQIETEDVALDPEEVQKIQERKKQAISVVGKPDAPGGDTEGNTMPPPHYRMLDSVLEQAPPLRRFKQPMLFDIFLALGLLIAVGGFTTGLMRIYITHMAKQSINQHNYKAAITILKRNAVPEFFSGFGSDPNDLLNQALYLDAMTKLEANEDDEAALKQLEKITADSRFFHLAQEILDEKSKPSEMQLKSGATHVASPDEMKAPAKQPLFEEQQEK